MLTRLRSHLTYANVTGTLALFLALGGTGAYAANEWTGANIQDETLTGADVQGKAQTSSVAAVNGSLTGYDISGQPSIPALGQPFIDGSLTTWDINDATLAGRDVQDGSLTTSDIFDGTLQGRDVQNNSLTGEDIFNNSLTGADIDESSLVGGPGSPSGAAGGDLTGSYPNPLVRSNAVGGNEVQDDSITGDDVNESSLDAPAYAHVAGDAVDAANSKLVAKAYSGTGFFCLYVYRFDPKNAVATIDPSGADTRDNISVSVVPTAVSNWCGGTGADAVVFTVNQAGAAASLPFYVLFH